MKTFKFEITITEEDVNGDEFWENAIKRDGTGISDLTEAIAQAIEDSNLMISSDKNPIDIIKLISYDDGKAEGLDVEIGLSDGEQWDEAKLAQVKEWVKTQNRLTPLPPPDEI